MTANSDRSSKEASPKKRTRTPRPYPVQTLEEAFSIARAIQEMNSGLPFDRVLLAKALGTTPASSGFTSKISSSARYGLTEGGYNDERIELTSRGRKAVGSSDPGERREAILEAALEPELFQRFYAMLGGKRLPEDAYAENVLRLELDVHESLAAESLGIIKANGLYAGILGDVGGSLYVSPAGAHVPKEQATPDAERGGEKPVRPAEGPATTESVEPPSIGEGKIFIGHAGNPDIVDYLKTVLEPFGIPYSVVESDFDANRPLSDELARHMRQCHAAILILAATSEPEWTGRREEKRREKMLYQLGAASVLFGDRVLTLTERPAGEPGQDAGFHTLGFRRDRLHELGLTVLAALHRKGVIEVRAPG